MNTIDSFVKKKQAESVFLSLEDGESVRIASLKDIKVVTKAGFGGEEKEVLRLKCSVETSEGLRDKDFDNGTQKFAKELQEKGVTIGSSFVITREGTLTKTRYHISEVTNPTAGVAQSASAQAAPAPAPAQPEAPAPAVDNAPSEPSTSAPVAP